MTDNKKLTIDSEQDSGEKLQKVLARAGIGSRREMEKLIGANRVTVNGKIAHVGDRVQARDRILVDGHPISMKASEERRTRVLIYNKPEGEICTARDPEGRPTVFARLPKLKGERWIAVGRLDFNTSGLLLFTTDGELANALMHPSANIDREYLCRVLGEADDDVLARLREGVMLDDGIARFTDITAGGGEGANRWYYVCLMEGRNREVRRLWESQNLKVSRLKRVRYGPVFLPARLKQGQWQDMPAEMILALYELIGLKAPTSVGVVPQDKLQRAREQRKNRPAAPKSARRPAPR
ncbi:MAG TPA: 23S rRNA pseudouridine(2605) synthase RluB [Spongiibacteraceae bacterium]|nr:23S rRNA pseudouridine(2605) synthase RluB [Spongiibacteraceae bacterium]